MGGAEQVAQKGRGRAYLAFVCSCVSAHSSACTCACVGRHTRVCVCNYSDKCDFLSLSGRRQAVAQE